MIDAKASREFRVVRDNRTNHKPSSKIKPPLQSQISSNEVEVPKFTNKRYCICLVACYFFSLYKITILGMYWSAGLFFFFG